MSSGSNQNGSENMNVRVTVIERNLIQKEKEHEKFDKKFSEIQEELVNLKRELWENKADPAIKEKIKQLEIDLNLVKNEIPDFRISKQISYGIATLALIAVFSAIIYSVVIPSKKLQTSVTSPINLNEAAKRIVDGYEQK